MTNADILRNMAKEYAESKPRAAKVAECILNAKGRFCRIVMKPQESDKKRNGQVRVFHTNVRTGILDYQRKHGIGNGRLTESGRKSVSTKFANAMIGIMESVHGKAGRFEVQPRTVALDKVAEVRYNGKTFTF